MGVFFIIVGVFFIIKGAFSVVGGMLIGFSNIMIVLYVLYVMLRLSV